MTHEAPSQGLPLRVVRGFIVLAGVLALTETIQLVPAWLAWRAGAPDLYADQHARMVASNARGVLLALALPVPLLLGRASRRGRVTLWALWAVAMLGWVALWLWRR